MSEVKAEIKIVNARIDSLDQKLSTRIDGLGSKMDEVDKRLSFKIDELDKRLDVTQRLAAVEEQVKELLARN